MARHGNNAEDFRSESETIRSRPPQREYQAEEDYEPKHRADSTLGSTTLAGTMGSRASSNEWQTSNERTPQRDKNLMLEDRIREAIVNQLRSDPAFVASDITIEIRERRAILSGEVDTQNSKYHAEQLVKRVRGVESVENRLKTRLGQVSDESNRSANSLKIKEELARKF